MAERASVFEEGGDFDLSGFAPKKPTTKSTPEPPAEAIRSVSEGANFRSREPKATANAAKKVPRRRRTGRNEQLNLKVTAKARELFYQITDSQGWVLGETFQKAIEALERELATKS